MSLGPVMLDLEGLELTLEERELLGHPSVGGVVLFSRNYAAPEQLRALVDAVHALREPRLLVAVDHEGGRVQRFREQFTRLPAPARLGRLYERDRGEALELAETCGWVLGAELRSVGVDVSFAPVLDLGGRASAVIGDRAFHRDPEVVAELARAYVRGMNRAGLAPVGKHFPGHGSVREDSHRELPVDERAFGALRVEDLVPFERMIHQGLSALMAAHVAYPEVDPRPAGFSRRWLGEVLRGELGFQGAVFSDDLSMAAAAVAGDAVGRAHAALEAGCDMVLACNDRAAAAAVLERLRPQSDPVSRLRLVRLHGRGGPSREHLVEDKAYRRASRVITALEPEPELDLGDDTPA